MPKVRIIETEEDYLGCDSITAYLAYEMIAVVYFDPNDENNPILTGYSAEIRLRETDEVFCRVRGFGTRAELVAWLNENDPLLQVEPGYVEVDKESDD